MSSMLVDSGRAPLAGLDFVRTLRGGTSSVADLFRGISKTVSELEAKWNEEEGFGQSRRVARKISAADGGRELVHFGPQ